MRIKAEDYEPLKAFFGWVCEHLIPLPESLPLEHRPFAALERLEGQSRAKAREGLGMAISDIMEEFEHLSPEQVAAVDAALKAEGIITFSWVRARFWSKVRSVLQRGMIRNEREYYAVRNVVEALSQDEQGSVWQMLAAFEGRVGKRA